MSNIIINVGISGSGKTSHSQNVISGDNSYLRINRDDIRKTLVGDLTKYYDRSDIVKLEIMVSEIEESLFYVLTNNNKNIIIDNTNLSKKYIDNWVNRISYLQEYKNYLFEFHIHHISLNKAKTRILRRDFNIDIPTMENNIDITNPEVDYINKQFNQFNEIVKYIENTNNFIITHFYK